MEKNIRAALSVGTSHYLKSMESAVWVEETPLGRFALAVEAANHDAKYEFLDFLRAAQNGEVAFDTYIRENLPGIFARDDKGAIENRKIINPMSFQGHEILDDLTAKELADSLIPRLIQKFGSLEAFGGWLFSHYTIGLSPSKAGALYAAKVNAKKEGSFAYFDYYEIKKTISDAIRLKSQLSGAYPKNVPVAFGSQEFFAIVRKLIHTTRDAGALNKELAKNLGVSVKMAQDIRAFLNTMNVLDYVNPEWLKPSDAMRSEFESLEGSGYILYTDIKNLGARGLKCIFDKLEALQMRTKIIDHKAKERQVARSTGKELEGIDDALEIQLDLLNIELENILLPANSFINESIATLQKILDEHKGELTYKMWMAGDDIYIRMVTSDVTLHRRFMPKLVSELGASLRFGIQDVSSGGKPTLAAARSEVGTTADTLKRLEKQGQTNIYGYYRPGGVTEVIHIN